MTGNVNLGWIFEGIKFDNASIKRPLNFENTCIRLWSGRYIAQIVKSFIIIQHIIWFGQKVENLVKSIEIVIKTAKNLVKIVYGFIKIIWIGKKIIKKSRK